MSDLRRVWIHMHGLPQWVWGDLVEMSLVLAVTPTLCLSMNRLPVQTPKSPPRVHLLRSIRCEISLVNQQMNHQWKSTLICAPRGKMAPWFDPLTLSPPTTKSGRHRGRLKRCCAHELLPAIQNSEVDLNNSLLQSGIPLAD